MTACKGVSAIPGTTVYTDEATVYGGLKRRYNHGSVMHSISEYVRGDVHTNGMESVWSVLTRSIHDTQYHVSLKHLGKYINEATFWLTRATAKSTPSSTWSLSPTRSATSALPTPSSSERTGCPQQ